MFIVELKINKKRKMTKTKQPLELENGEFLILEDGQCHMIAQTDNQLQFTPSTLSLTNFHIFVNPQYDNEILRKIALSDIIKFDKKDVDETPVLDIISEDSAQSIRLFIPEEKHRTAFITIFNKLCAANEIGQEKCNECELKFRRKLQSAGTLNEFYEEINSGVDEESSSEKTELENELQIRQFSSYFEKLFIFCDYFADIIETSPLFFFIPILIIAGVLTIILKYVNLGVFLPSVMLISIIFIAILINIGKIKEEGDLDFTNSAPNIREFMTPIHSFKQEMKSRFSWLTPEVTLQTCEFLLILIIMFGCLDTFFILIASLIGLAFVERWDPFRFGSLSTFLSHLILW